MAVEILRPNAPGDVTGITYQYPVSGVHWDKVDEEVADEHSTFIYEQTPKRNGYDLYHIPDHSVGSGTINKITVYFRCDEYSVGASAKAVIKSNTTTTYGDTKNLTWEWVTYSQEWAVNPADGQPWGSDWSVIDNLQIGIYLNLGGDVYAECTQVYVEVDYTLAVETPTVTTQAVSDIAATTATGNGNITDVGAENCSKRGVCWNTTGSPTVADDKSEETDSFGTGAFSRPMTGLVAETHYYVRAYAYNSYGYGYGNQVEFDTAVSDIDVGADPIDRATAYLFGYTSVNKTNPANGSGILHTVKAYAETNITGLRVGTFYTTNGNTLKCRDSEAIGNVEAGAVRTFTGLSITVVEGDYIGCYWTGGNIEADTSGFAGVWDVEGEYIDPGDETEYALYDGHALSLSGYGDFLVVGLEKKSANMAAKMIAAGLI